jgi:2'-5' RNA ligase
MDRKIRTFVAFALPGQVLERLRKHADRLKARRLPVRWVKPENIHLTVKFLGDIRPSEVDPVFQAMRATAAACRAANLSAGGLGVFPGIKKPRVLWVGVTGELEALSRVHADLETRLEQAGFPREKRPFKSHLTLGRFKEGVDPKSLAEILGSCSDISPAPFEARELTLYKSDLKPSGAVYTELKSVCLAGPDSSSTD